MNQRAVDALVGAAMRGVPQIKDKFGDDAGGRCVMGVLLDSAGMLEQTGRLRAECTIYDIMGMFGLSYDAVECPECGVECHAGEDDLLMHLNDTHEWDFLSIARKLGG